MMRSRQPQSPAASHDFLDFPVAIATRISPPWPFLVNGGQEARDSGAQRGLTAASPS
jgi:hypothetical protein